MSGPKKPAKNKTRKKALESHAQVQPSTKKDRNDRSLTATKKKVATQTQKMPPICEAREAREAGQFPIVGIGASAGGLNALMRFFEVMPPASEMAFVVVSHLAPTKASILPEILQKQTEMPTIEVREGMVIEKNCVYVITPGIGLTVTDGVFHLLPRDVDDHQVMPIDDFLHSLAMDKGSAALAVILSGSGTDGTRGAKAIKEQGGFVIVQDEASAKYQGMPKSAIDAQTADDVLPPEQIPAKLIELSLLPRRPDGDFNNLSVQIGAQLPTITSLLQRKLQQDYTNYKKGTLIRRILRRMGSLKISAVNQYINYLKQDDKEAVALIKELRIGVTAFFRDKEAFAAFEQALYAYLEKKSGTDGNSHQLRVWCVGCSSGEEAYSLAILINECSQSIRAHVSTQIFATDIDKDSITSARRGVYSSDTLKDIPKEWLQRYFKLTEGGFYQIDKKIRDMLIFAEQNAITHPPFIKIDVISCRNLLIYFEPVLQQKMLSTFRFSLNPGGILFLGPSETLAAAGEYFDTYNVKWKVFARKEGDANASLLEHRVAFPDFRYYPMSKKNSDILPPEELKANVTAQIVEAILLKNKIAPCVVIDRDLNIVYLHGETGNFLETPPGRISTNIINLARPAFVDSIKKSIQAASKTKCQAVAKVKKARDHGVNHDVLIKVVPLIDIRDLHHMKLVVFEEDYESSNKRGGATTRAKREKELEGEILQTRKALQITIEELETSNDELRSINEELQSTNEELQSTNEEIETSKEELQSANEESLTLNSELQVKIDDLKTMNDDIQNLFDSTNIATLFLDLRFQIRRFTPKVSDIIPLTSQDIKRPLSHFSTPFSHINLENIAKATLEQGVETMVEAKAYDGRQFRIRALPYRTTANAIDGIVMTFEDSSVQHQAVTALKQAFDELADENKALSAKLREIAPRET